jgi:hypothetical protein
MGISKPKKETTTMFFNSKFNREYVITLRALFLLLSLAVIAPVHAQANTVTTNYRDSFSAELWNPCALGGQGESVLFTGEIHHLYHFMTNGNGNFQLRTTTNVQGASGIGLTSGDRYQLVLAYNSDFLMFGSPFPIVQTIVDTLRTVTPGGGNDFVMKVYYRVVINPDGVATTFRDSLTFECQ